MQASVSAPLLSRIKSWQLIGLGVSGWITLYSVALITWSSNSTIIGNAQGGCFAAAMTLASMESRRHKNGGTTQADPLQWINAINTDQLNQILAQVMEKQEFRVETLHSNESEMGFGVRAVNAGRTWIFETGRWQEPVIDLHHVITTEENRKKILADLAIIVGTGTPDEAAEIFVKTHPIQLVTGEEFRNMLAAEQPPVQTSAEPATSLLDTNFPNDSETA